MMLTKLVADAAKEVPDSAYMWGPGLRMAGAR